MRTVFMGSPSFALPTLLALAEHYQLAGVVTQPDRRAGRGRILRAPPAKEAALRLRIPIIQPTNVNHPSSLSQLRAWAPDFIVVSAYGQILRSSILDLPRFGCLNVHASLLPRWRGAAPVQAAIFHGDLQTGVTIMLLDPGMDTGPILAQRETAILDGETGGRLEARLATLGAELLLDVLPAYLQGDLQPTPQDDSKASYAPSLKKADGQLDWRKSSPALARQVRAFDPWPRSFFAWEQRRIIVHAARAFPDLSIEIGRVTSHQGLPAIGTSQGALILDTLQLPGRKPTSGRAFLHGARGFEGSLLSPPT
ncbi:MAG: methionyl-tRNA formyltransferase [Anaerolineales bacterium]|jgi:methionyl-tRNA formyltransferase